MEARDPREPAPEDTVTQAGPPETAHPMALDPLTVTWPWYVPSGRGVPPGELSILTVIAWGEPGVSVPLRGASTESQPVGEAGASMKTATDQARSWPPVLLKLRN